MIRAQDKARDVGRELEALLWRSINPTAADIDRCMGELSDNALDSASLRTAIAEVRGQQYIMARAGSPSPDYIGLATLLITLLRVLWLNRIRQGLR